MGVRSEVTIMDSNWRAAVQPVACIAPYAEEEKLQLFFENMHAGRAYRGKHNQVLFLSFSPQTRAITALTQAWFVLW